MIINSGAAKLVSRNMVYSLSLDRGQSEPCNLMAQSKFYYSGTRIIHYLSVIERVIENIEILKPILHYEILKRVQDDIVQHMVQNDTI